MRPVRFAVLALVLSACRSTPVKPSPKPANSDAGAPTRTLAVPGAAPTASAFIDTGFPNQDQPELVTARRLFPTAFGFDDGPPGNDVNHLLLDAGHLFDGLPKPPAHCLNSIAQAPVADAVLRLLASSNTDETNRTFSVNEAIVLKDWSRHYVIGVPKGAHGVLLLPPPAPSYGIHDNEQTDERFSIVLSDATVIYPDGHSLRLPPGDNLYAGGAILVITDRLRVRLCANDPRYKAKGCADSDPAVRIADAPPRDFDLRRCEPGCEQTCSKSEIRPRSCPAPPAPRCTGEQQRLFLDGRDVGEYCVFEEWDVQCEQGCRDDKCRGAPQLAWSRKIAAGYLAFALDAQTLALTEGEELITLSADGDVLRREKPPQGEQFLLASDQHGHLFTLDGHNVLRSRGERPWSIELDKSASVFETALRYRAGKLYLARGTGITCLDAVTHQQEWHAELGVEARPYLEVSDTSLAVLTVDQEIVVMGLEGAIRGRAKLPAEALGRFSLDGDTLTAYVKSGEVLSGRIDHLRRIALIPQAEWRPLGMAQLREGVVLLNRGTDHHGSTRIHALELASGRELWNYSTPGQLQWPPLVDRRGGILLVGQKLVSLTRDGLARFKIDLRSGPQSEAAATFGLDGSSFYVRTPRGLTKFTGL